MFASSGLIAVEDAPKPGRKKNRKFSQDSVFLESGLR